MTHRWCTKDWSNDLPLSFVHVATQLGGSSGCGLVIGRRACWRRMAGSADSMSRGRKRPAVHDLLHRVDMRSQHGDEVCCVRRLAEGRYAGDLVNQPGQREMIERLSDDPL